MPLFHSNTTTPSTASSSRQPRAQDRQDVSPTSSTRRSGLFGSSSRAEKSPTAASITSTSTNNTNGMKHSTSLLHRARHGSNSGEDPSISAARQQVVLAEGAERDADRALIAARQAVRDAKEHVKALEREAAEEARLAKIKQEQARDISKRARPLGRFGN